MNHKAFTLIELLVVVAIIGILAAVGVTTFNGFQEKAKIAVVKSNHKSATKFIQAEIFRADAFSEVSQWNSIKKTCRLVNANSVWHTHGQWAFGCLTEDISNKNPFKSSEVAFWNDWDPPTVNNVGRTNCNWSDARGTFTCYSRWGSNTNDYETSIIKQP